MSLLLISCPHCTKRAKIDSDKLPDQPVFFPCPHCNGRVVVDKRKLASQPKAPAAPAPQPETAASVPEEFTLPEVEPTIPDRRFAKLPADAVLPSGIIVGEDELVISEVREALAALGSEVEPVASPDAARQMIVDEYPDLCIYVAGKIEATPHAPMAPLRGLHPSSRRRLYLMLIADDLKTFDGNAAFMHQVNMVLGKPDLPQIGAALYRGLEYHERLYKAYMEASEKKGSI